MSKSPPSAEALAGSVEDAVTQWFTRNASTTVEMIDSSDDWEPQVELSASGHSFPHVIVSALTVTVKTPKLSLDYEIRAQFRHPFEEPARPAVVAEFVRSTAAPMLLGMVRGAIATESSIFDQGKILLPFFVEKDLQKLPDSAFVAEE